MILELPCILDCKKDACYVYKTNIMKNMKMNYGINKGIQTKTILI